MFSIFLILYCVRDPETTIAPKLLEDLVVELDLTIVRKPVGIVARDEKRLRTKTVRLLKV